MEHDHHRHGEHGREPAQREERQGKEPGARASGHVGHEGHDKHAGHTPEMFRDRFWFSFALTLIILYFDAHVQGLLGYTAPVFPGSNWVQPVLAVILYVYGGWVFVAGAIGELRARLPGMMTLIAVAISVAFVYSLAVTLGLPGMPLYWELATLISVMLLGHWIEMLSIQGASRALEHLAALVPSEAHRLEDGGVVDVPISELAAGDRILVRPGEQVPADGGVVEGASSVNEAFLTGESRPVAKEPGSEVVAGAVNGEGALTVEVTRTGEGTTLSQIMRLVAEAQSSRSRFQAVADRAAYWLTLIAVAGGAITLVVWLALGQPGDFAINRMVALMVIACPHALGLAIPLVTVNATAIAAKNGILVRNREAFERARGIRFVAFDKTGTLTEGRFGVRAVHAPELGEEAALGLAAALETRSEHPLAQAVVQAASERGIRAEAVTDFTVAAGRGVEGSVDGRRYRVGRPEWPGEMGVTTSERLQAGLDEAESRGESVIALFDEKRVLALIALADQVRKGVRRTVGDLKRMGVTPIMITGDAEAVARTVAEELGIERYHARVLPQDKAKLVRELAAEGPVAFVGDGINDAPALVEADLGVAIGAGTNVAIESADLVLIEDDPGDVVRALRLSRATYGKMIQNLYWATGYNTVAIPLAAGVAYPIGVLLTPALGAVFMSLSTVIVAINAMLLRRVRLD
jgi:P-type Cu2+ transporter